MMESTQKLRLDFHQYLSKGESMYHFRIIAVCLLLFFFIACNKNEQEKTATTDKQSKQEMLQAETSSEVPELWEFHDVIYQIWHEAWPEKNTQMLKDLIPEIEMGFAKLERASLPGILRDKKDAWTQGIQNMAGIIEDYKNAAKSNQKEALLKAAEDLHSQFEMLVRLIRPVMKEIDHFHQELYLLYHYYMPEYNLQKIKSSTATLIARMETIDKAKLPTRLQDKQQDYDESKDSLRQTLKSLQQLLDNQPEKDQVVNAIEVVHSKYQMLIGLFE
jgi:hypothetical protein